MADNGNIKFLKKDDLTKWLGGINDRTIVAPTMENGMVIYRPVIKLDSLDLELPRPKRAPKDFFFKETEKIFDFKDESTKSGSGAKYTQPPKPPEILILGVRPCDGRALAFQDRIFLEKNHGFVDPMYKQRREAAIVVAQACDRPERNCFCTSVGGDPSSPEGSDVLMTPTSDGYILEGTSDRGEKFLNGPDTSDLMTDATGDRLKERDRIHESNRQRVPRKVETGNIKEKLEGNFDNPYWMELGRQCLGCGICTFLCPSCHCFDIQDERTAEGGRRFRVWDTCQFLEYTQHAGGHNPRPEKGHRIRNRVYDKFKYTVDAFGMVSCVGCGRCSSLCPEAIDMVEILQNVGKMEEGSQ